MVTATKIVNTGAMMKGLEIDAIWSQESITHKQVVRDNAMYRFTLEGINISHMGGIGNPLTESQLDALAGTDILPALTGGPPTIELEDLCKVIEMVKPKVVIPMHNRIPGPRFFMLPVTDFTKCYPDLMVEWSDSAEV